MKIILGLAAFLILAIAGIGFAYPAAAAVACPSCYGFAGLGDGIYVEKGATAAERQEAEAVVDAARGRVEGFYGTLEGSPRILICRTEDCYRPIGGGSRGQAILDWALFLSPRGTSTMIAAHELSHIELHSRLGLAKTWNRAVPQWFDEGLAADISGDPRYLRQTGDGDRCLVEPGGDMPVTRGAWVESARTQELYARAACRVDRWIKANGGPQAVARLADRVAQGERFQAAAGQALSQ
jgi:hypothetical protein